MNLSCFTFIFLTCSIVNLTYLTLSDSIFKLTSTTFSLFTGYLQLVHCLRLSPSLQLVFIPFAFGSVRSALWRFYCLISLK